MKRVLIVLEGYINLLEANTICNDLLVKNKIAIGF